MFAGHTSDPVQQKVGNEERKVQHRRHHTREPASEPSAATASLCTGLNMAATL